MKPLKFIYSNFLITTLTLVSVAINFLTQIVLAYYFGAKFERDAYFSALVIPTYLTGLFVGSFSAVFLPFVIEVKKNKNLDETQRMLSGIFGFFIVILVLITLLSFAFSSEIILKTAPGFKKEQLDLTNKLFRILIFSTIFQFFGSLIAVFYHVKNRFFWPSFSPIIVSIMSLFFVLSFHRLGIESLAYGTLFGNIVAFLLMLPVLKGKIKFHYLTRFIHKDTFRIIKNSFPLFISGSVSRSTLIVERIIASSLPLGSISYLGYGNQIYVLLSSIASGSIATTFYPSISNAWSDQNKEEIARLFQNGLKIILLITLPIAVIFIVFGKPIIRILFERGQFDSVATDGVAITLSILMGAFVFTSVGNVIVKFFYVSSKTITVSIISIFEVILYYFLAYFLSLKYSFLGLAIAQTISTGGTIFITMYFLLREKIILSTVFFLFLIKLFLISIFCIFSSHYLYFLFNLSRSFWVVSLCISLTIFTYVILLDYFKLIDLKSFITKIKIRF